MLRRRLSLLLTSLAVAPLGSAGVAAAIMVLWHGQGKQILAVQSNSMRPIFQVGDAVVVDTDQNQRLQPGKIVSYHSLTASQLLISHRVVSVERRTDQVITHGDNLSNADPPFSASRIIGVDIAVLPGFGHVLNAARQPWALAVFIYLPALSIVAREAWALADHLTQKTYCLPERL